MNYGDKISIEGFYLERNFKLAYNKMNSLIQRKLSHHKTHTINKEWRNGGTERLVQAEHSFCLTALTIKACVACVNKKGLGNGRGKR